MSRTNFKRIFEFVNIPPEEMDLPISASKKNKNLCYKDPNSAIFCLIVYLYSMEIGSPPLYAEANRVARDNDLNFVKELGPFLQALGKITSQLEVKKSAQF